MTPDEARRAIREAEDLRSNLPADCWRALETIAGMHAEYRAEYQTASGRWFPAPNSGSCTRGWGTKQQAERNAADDCTNGYPTRIVRRYVTKEEA